jgi:hypothetical protein
MHQAKFIRYGLANALLVVVAAGAFVAGQAQEKGKEKSVKPEKTAPEKTLSNNGGRDPFGKYQPPRVVIRKSNLMTPPSIQVRIDQYRAQKMAAMNAHAPAPKPTTALLLGELQVIGITRTPRGYAAIVEATPIKLSYVIYPGEKFYDGQLVAIEDQRLVFRHETVFSDSKREFSVETKALRQQPPVDAMTAAKVTPPAEAGAAEKKPEEKPATSEKP